MNEVSWRGIKAFQVMCDKLPDRIVGKKLNEAYKYALEPTKQQMQSNVPKDSYGLYYSIAITVDKTNIGLSSAIVGPRRKKNAWNMKGRHAYIVEMGTKAHIVKAKRVKAMPVFNGGRLSGFTKEFQHPGTEKNKRPFGKAIDSTWREASGRMSKRFSAIMLEEMKSIYSQYGSVESK